MLIEFFLSIFWMSLIFTGHFVSLKLGSFAKSLSALIILAGWWSSGCNYLTKQHLKHSLSSISWVLIKPFLGWSNSFSNLIITAIR